MAKVNIEAEVRAANFALKADLYRVRIELRGKKLSLVATLPPKPTSNQRKAHQQRISLKLNASRLGLRKAKAEAIKLGDQLDRDKFTWEDWIDIPSDEPEIKTCNYWLDKFKAHIWKDLPEDKEFNWKKRFLYLGFNKLPLDKPLTADVLIAAALTKPETKKAARDKACDRLQRFANFAGVDVDLKPYKAGYSISDIKARDIPTDERIESLIDGIEDARWKHVFALMATYGLRNHEAFLCTLEEDQDGRLVANVPQNTKTGQHIAYPYRKEWVGRWDLANGQPPQFNVRSHQEYGRETSDYWRDRLNYPGTPYNLRHAYAQRCHMEGAPIAIASQWMGHSPETHLKRYQRWINEATQREVWDKM